MKVILRYFPGKPNLHQGQLSRNHVGCLVGSHDAMPNWTLTFYVIYHHVIVYPSRIYEDVFSREVDAFCDQALNSDCALLCF